MITYNGNIVVNNGRWINQPPPPVMPPYTIRLKYKDGVIPTFNKGTAVQVSQNPNIWDLTYVNNDWTSVLRYHYDLISVISANTTNVTNMYLLFDSCTSLVSVPLFDTSKVTNMKYMFNHCASLKYVPLLDMSRVELTDSMFDECSSLTKVPLFNLSNVTSMYAMFWGCNSLQYIPLFNTNKVRDCRIAFAYCYNVEGGALALYQQMSSQTNPPVDHSYCFRDCGRDTQTGAAELAQIPGGGSWR